MKKRKITSLLSAAILLSGVIFPGLAPIQSFADSNPKLVLRVPDVTGETGHDYLNGATYDVYLKYLIDDNGKLLNPKTGVLETNQTNDHGKLPDLSAAHKMGTVTINGKLNEFALTSTAPHLAGKNLGRAIYTIVPVKRALGYLLDKNDEGKYAEVEFPKLQDDGSLDPDQTFTITLKAKKAKGKGDVTLFVKKGEKGEPLAGMQFNLQLIKKPLEIGDDNKVSRWESYENIPNAPSLGTLESGPDGKVIIPESQALSEGCYYLTELNAKEKGYAPEGFCFSYMPDEENRMMINFNDEIIGNQRQYYVNFDSPGKVEDGSVISLYNYEINPVTKEIIGNDNSVGMTNTISPNEKFVYKMSSKFPAFYRRAGIVAITFWEEFDKKLKPAFDTNFTSVGGSDLSKEVSVWYQKPSGEIVEMEKDRHFTIQYGESLNVLIVKMSGDQAKQFMEDTHGIPKTKEYPIYTNYSLTESNKQEETGKMFVQVPMMVNGSKVTDDDFDATKNMEGIGDKLEVRFGKYLKGIGQAAASYAYNERVFSEKPVTKPIRTEIKIMKKDKSGAVLPNAEFMVYDVNDSSGEPLKPYDHASAEPYTVKSDDQGRITAEKLPYRLGGYFLKETKAPQGYRLPKALFAFENKTQLPIVGNTGDTGQYDIKLGSHTDADQIVNIKKGEDIVNTGTMGTVASLLGGASILGLGVLSKKRKRK